MSDEIISRSNNISLAEDAIGAYGGASRSIASWITSNGLTNAETEDTCSRNVRSFTTFRASGLPAIARRDSPTFDNGCKMLNHRRDSPQQRHARQSSVPQQERNDAIEEGYASQRYENAVLRYHQRSKSRPRRQISRERQQQQSSNYSSSDESVARNKSKSTSSIDAQSVNNILDEYEDLDYRRSSDLSDVGSINVTNFEAVMMDQQKRQQQQQGRSKLTGAKVQTRSIPTREKVQPVLKVNQQTQVRQRSRDRQRESSKGHQQDVPCSSVTTDRDAIESGRSKMPEILLRKGEVQKRVDEWLNQAHSQNFPVSTREKPLTRSNSSVEQKSQRRYRGRDSRSRLIDEARDRLNGGASSSYDDLTRVDRKMEHHGRLDKVNVGVNTSRGTYKEYLAVKSKIKQQDYGFSAQSSVASSRSGDSSPASRIPQRGPLGSSFRSRRAEANPEERATTDGRVTNLAKRGESDHVRAIANATSKVVEASNVTTSITTTATSIIPCRRPSLKRSGNEADQNCAAMATRSLVKEETNPRSSKGPAGSLGDQGEPISPNKDGESRRPVVMRLTAAAAAVDKAVEATACKSTEAPMRSVGNHPRDGSSRIASTTESDRISAIESPRRRPQISGDVRKEPRSIDQPRQEQSVYGLAVSARVRALQGQAESRGSRTRCHQVVPGAPMEVRKPVLPRRDLGVSPSRDVASQDRAKVSIGVPSSSFKPNDRVYTATSGSNERNVAKSKIAACEIVPSGRVARYASPDHVERIYERSLQPQVIHADDLESIPRPSLQVSPYGEKVGVIRSDRESSVKETSTAREGEQTFDRIGETRHEHLETIEEDDRKSESSIRRYPEVGLKQCLKVQQSLPNGRSKESTDKKDSSSTYTKRDRQQQIVDEPARTFATFQSTSPCRSNVKSSVHQPQSSDMRGSKGREEIRQDLDESATILEDFTATDYEDASREEQKRPTIHSRENSNLSTATIPVDELESQRGVTRFKNEEDASCNRLQSDEKSRDRAAQEMAKDVDERGAVVNEILVKNLQFEQDLPEDPVEQTRSDHVVQQVNFHNVLCDDYENVKSKERKVYMTKEEMDHQRLMDMLRKRDFNTLKTVSDILYSCTLG